MRTGVSHEWFEIGPELVARQPLRHTATYLTVDDIPYMCWVIDITDAGARVDLETALFLDGDMRLVMGGEEADVACSVAWRQGNSLGLSFHP